MTTETDDLALRARALARNLYATHVVYAEKTIAEALMETADTIERLQRDLRECVELLELAVFLPSDRRNHDVDPPDCPECKRDALLARLKESKTL